MIRTNNHLVEVDATFVHLQEAFVDNGRVVPSRQRVLIASRRDLNKIALLNVRKRIRAIGSGRPGDIKISYRLALVRRGADYDRKKERKCELVKGV